MAVVIDGSLVRSCDDGSPAGEKLEVELNYQTAVVVF